MRKLTVCVTKAMIFRGPFPQVAIPEIPVTTFVLQHAAARGDKPALIRIETRAGHGAGTPTAKLIETAADVFAFLAASLHMQAPK